MTKASKEKKKKKEIKNANMLIIKNFLLKKPLINDNQNQFQKISVKIQ